MTTNNSVIAQELCDLENGRLDPKQFPHREHVRLAFEMLGRYPFPEALARFSKGLRQLAIKGGRPEVYHETITAAFLALIGERRCNGEYANWEEFSAHNGDLMSKDLLRQWYEPEVLNSAVARRTFVLPRPAPNQNIVRKADALSEGRWNALSERVVKNGGEAAFV